MAAQYVLEDMADVPVRVELASEFRYRGALPLDQKALVIVVSQSGETADALWQHCVWQKRRALPRWQSLMW